MSKNRSKPFKTNKIERMGFDSFSSKIPIKNYHFLCFFSDKILTRVLFFIELFEELLSTYIIMFHMVFSFLC